MPALHRKMCLIGANLVQSPRIVAIRAENTGVHEKVVQSVIGATLNRRDGSVRVVSGFEADSRDIRVYGNHQNKEKGRWRGTVPRPDQPSKNVALVTKSGRRPPVHRAGADVLAVSHIAWCGLAVRGGLLHPLRLVHRQRIKLMQPILAIRVADPARRHHKQWVHQAFRRLVAVITEPSQVRQRVDQARAAVRSVGHGLQVARVGGLPAG